MRQTPCHRNGWFDLWKVYMCQVETIQLKTKAKFIDNVVTKTQKKNAAKKNRSKR